MKSKQMRLCGHDVQIVVREPGNWESNGMGRASSMTCEILLNPAMNESAMHGTFLHEMVHLIADMNGMSNAVRDETTVSVIANSFYAWMRDNHELVREISGIRADKPKAKKRK